MSFLRDAINQLDPAPDKKKELTFALNLLSELCAQKVETFDRAITEDLRTAGSGENRTIPVTEILARHTEYRAYVKDDVGKIAKEVGDAVKKFVQGGSDKIIDGVGSLVTTALEAILGAGEGMQAEMKSYYIVVQDYAIARYDIRAWTRHIEAAGITSKIETAMAIVSFKSSADVTKISFNTFLLSYAAQLSLMGFTPQEQQEYMDYAEKIYNKLRNANSGVRQAPLSADQPEFPGPKSVQFRSPGQLYGSLWD
jgi:hypothetical protein